MRFFLVERKHESLFFKLKTLIHANKLLVVITSEDYMDAGFSKHTLEFDILKCLNKEPPDHFLLLCLD